MFTWCLGARSECSMVSLNIWSMNYDTSVYKRVKESPQKMGKKQARIWQPDLTLYSRESKVYRKIPKVHFHPRKTNHWLLATFLVSTDRTKNEARTLFEKSRHMIFDSMDSSNFAMLFAKIWVVHVVYLYSFSRYTNMSWHFNIHLYSSQNSPGPTSPSSRVCEAQ